MVRYTFRYILENRYDPNRTKARIMAEKYVIMSRLSKFIAPPFVYIFLNLGISADLITFASIFFVLAGGAFFILGFPLFAVISVLIFALFDSVDGDMARIVGPSRYGGVLDSFGADFFYAFIPMTSSFYLYSIGIESLFLTSGQIFLVGSLVSLTLLLYRLIEAKLTNFLGRHGNRNGQKVKEKPFMNTRGSFAHEFIVKSIFLYRHVIVRNNLFAEPALILWISLFILLKLHTLLTYYLLFVLVYNIGYLFINFAKAYKTFLSYK